ncbi:MAG TPA: serine/threonine-protein kinase [Anaerolineaceae bacterium]|nr:serine/threonine-protein kinase [Anaerolineaceae bacterium]
MKQLGKYEIIELIGKGAYAEVYRAVDTTLDRTVALKLLKPALLADEDAVGRFMREARTAANLIHPRIAWVWEVGELEGRFYIAMRFIEGQPLDQFLKSQGPLPWAQAQEIIQQIGEALSYAHGRGLVHRDVKPQNVLLSKDEGAILTDFGLVRAMESSGVGTRTGVLMGTPAYMAPEIWRGENAGPAADQYALACILCELLTGQQLFGAANTPAVILRHMQPPQLPEQWPANCSPNLSLTLGKALDPQPDQRYGSVADFIAMVATAEEPGTAPASNDTQSGNQIGQAQNPNIPADDQASEPEQFKPLELRVRARQKSATKPTQANQSPKHNPAELAKSGHQRPYWPALLWIALGWTPSALFVFDMWGIINLGISYSLPLAILAFAIAAGLGWTITGLAIKKQYQLESKHIVRLLLLGIGSGIIGWILGEIFSYLIFRVFVPFSVLSLLLTSFISFLIMGAASGAIMIAILEAARKRAARQTETN